MITVLLADDQSLIRSGIRVILSNDGGFVVDEVASGEHALERVAQGDIDLVLMDIRMPGMDGVEATRRIRALPCGHATKILVLTTFENDSTVVDAISAGADGFVGKGIEPSELIAIIREVVDGKPQLSDGATAALVRHVAGRARAVSAADPRLAAKLDRLTPRERGIVAAVARGLTNDQIAAREFISPYTVKTHLNRAMSKLEVGDRGQLVRLAFLSGVVEEG